MVPLILAVGVVLSLGWVALRAPGGQQTQHIDAAAGVLLGCLLGGRLGYVLVNWSYYQFHLAETVQVWSGGLSGVGAALGGALALPLLAWLTRRKLALFADQMLPLLVVLPATGWLSCWLAGSAYGIPASGAWWGLLTVDEWGMVVPRFPLQLLGVLLALGIPWLIEAWAESRFGQGKARTKSSTTQQAQPGMRSTLTLLGLALTLLGLSFLRADPTTLWNSLRPETWGAFVLLVFSAAGLTWGWRV